MTLGLQLVSVAQDATPYGYTNFIEEVFLPDIGVRRSSKSPVFSSGNDFIGSTFLKDGGGSRYELHTVKVTQGEVKSYFLADTVIDPFQPRGTITITTGDPFNDPTDARYRDAIGPRRTRADMQEGFTVSSEITGLTNDQTKPRCFRVLTGTQTLQSYGPPKVQAAGYPDPPIPGPVVEFTRNETYPLRYQTSLPRLTARPFSQCGEETFTVTSLLDTQLSDQIIPVRTLDQKTVQIWPQSWGAHTPYVGEGQVFRDLIPPITFTGNDLYPLSDNYLEYYQGEPSEARVPTAIRIDGGRTNTDAWSVSGMLFTTPSTPAYNLNTLLNRDGVWTVQLVTTTPQSFGDWRRLKHTRIVVDRRIRVNTTLTTSE